jgi:septin 7
MDSARVTAAAQAESHLPKENPTDGSESPGAMSNGTPVAKSPSPQVPNGKPTSPYVKESNPMGSGAAQTVSSKDPKAAAQAASDMRNVVRRKLTGYVGFANLPNQWHRKSVRKGFNFNVMVVGKCIVTRPANGADSSR